MSEQQIDDAARAISRQGAWCGVCDEPRYEVCVLCHDTCQTFARAALAAAHPTITSLDGLDALDLGAVVHCAGDQTGGEDGDQTFIFTGVLPLPWRNNWIRSSSEGLLESYETITVLHVGDGGAV